MARYASGLLVFALTIGLFFLIGAFCIYIVKTVHWIPPVVVFGVAGGLYTMLVLFILHSFAGTLSPSPEELRDQAMSRENEAEGDLL
ncbi:hypothetical protein [Methylopila turkensis]|uniref:Uncharacterized protein n=1 Tax=Methylopila turkensis TaxID=1437816 RepID=A0A9W6JM60_9HYPH|nr:hypothetical protein [Methylopila turkensis]GLK80160.1 hypothetical protein GCM10008174_19010 [Methylopila turkensis]